MCMIVCSHLFDVHNFKKKNIYIYIYIYIYKSGQEVLNDEYREEN